MLCIFSAFLHCTELMRPSIRLDMPYAETLYHNIHHSSETAFIERLVVYSHVIN